jgi:nucleolar protein 9
MEELLAVAHHPTSSRILDAYLESPEVPFKAKRQLVTPFIGHFHQLVDDRIGSRIGDRCWAFADPYLKVCLRALFTASSPLTNLVRSDSTSF